MFRGGGVIIGWCNAKFLTHHPLSCSSHDARTVLVRVNRIQVYPSIIFAAKTHINQYLNWATDICTHFLDHIKWWWDLFLFSCYLLDIYYTLFRCDCSQMYWIYLFKCFQFSHQTTHVSSVQKTLVSFFNLTGKIVENV